MAAGELGTPLLGSEKKKSARSSTTRNLKIIFKEAAAIKATVIAVFNLI